MYNNGKFLDFQCNEHIYEGDSSKEIHSVRIGGVIFKSSNVSSVSPQIENISESPEVSNSVNISKDYFSEEECQSTLNETVMPSVSTLVDSKNNTTKGNYCYFCDKKVSKISRHFENVHSDEVEVQKFLSLPKFSKQRKIIQSNLRNKGNHIHNECVYKSGKGKLLPNRRSRTEKTIDEYLPCIHCKGVYQKKVLWIHHKTCPQNTKKQTHRRVVTEAYLSTKGLAVSEQFQKAILFPMKPDEITKLVTKDDLLMKFGEKQYSKNPESKQNNYIRQRLRQSARLLMNLMDINESVYNMDQAIDPKIYNDVISAVRITAGFKETNFQYDAAVLPLKIGHNLKALAAIKESEAIKSGDKIKKEQAEDFLNLIEKNWSFDVSSSALKTLADRKFNNPEYLPLASDIKLLSDYLDKNIDYSIKQIGEGNLNEYRRCAELTLASLILFNRKRAGEAQRILIKNFDDGLLCKRISKDAEACLSMVEKKLLNKFQRIEIKGKRGRRVPVLMRNIHVKAIELIINNRKEAGVADENPFIFAINNYNSMNPIDACGVMRTVSSEANLEKPELLRSTKLRKHVATMAQLLCLDKPELEQLSQFMGHSLNVHLEFYRLPVDVVQIAKVGKVLQAMEDGLDVKSMGTTLDDIVINERDGEFCHMIVYLTA